MRRVWFIFEKKKKETLKLQIMRKLYLILMTKYTLFLKLILWPNKPKTHSPNYKLNVHFAYLFFLLLLQRCKLFLGTHNPQVLYWLRFFSISFGPESLLQTITEFFTFSFNKVSKTSRFCLYLLILFSLTFERISKSFCTVVIYLKYFLLLRMSSVDSPRK